MYKRQGFSPTSDLGRRSVLRRTVGSQLQHSRRHTSAHCCPEAARASNQAAAARAAADRAAADRVAATLVQQMQTTPEFLIPVHSRSASQRALVPVTECDERVVS